MSFTTTKNFGVKMPNRARYRKCPVCIQPCTAREFRTSNRNPKQYSICWQCRSQNPRCAEQLYGANKGRRQTSVFRQKVWAIKRLLDKKLKKKEVKNMRKEVIAQSVQFLKMPERIAAIVGKTYSVMGDDFKLADDEALTRIRDLLDELDSTLIERNKKKRLSR